MNYFAHACPYLDDPHFVAGTAVPDWLNVVQRRSKARQRLAQPLIQDADPQVAALARGVVQHHLDDAWFHQTRAFAELALQFTVRLREVLAPDDGFRPSFLGHILVELLLDAALIEEAPQDLQKYYACIDSLDPEMVGRTVNRMTTQTTGMLSMFIPRFSAARFLYDYSDNEKLLFRLNNVMRRVRLPALPRQLLVELPAAREAVRQRRDDLLRGRPAPFTAGSDPSSSSGELP